MRIAHLSDLHVLERHAARRRGADRVRLELICNGRAVDPEDRRLRLLRSLEAARAEGVDHLVITGDLTEDGHPDQFEMLAEILDDAGVDPHRTTLLAGNHDAYTSMEAFDDALDGPLAAYAATSRACHVVDLGDAVILPLCTRMNQPFVRAAGMVGASARQWLARTLRDPAHAHRTVMVALHHPLVPRSMGAYQWFDGLVDAAELTAVLRRHRPVDLLHGHWHRKMDLPIGEGVQLRSRGAFAVVDHPRPMRSYVAAHGRLHAEGEPVSTGETTSAPAVS